MAAESARTAAGVADAEAAEGVLDVVSTVAVHCGFEEHSAAGYAVGYAGPVACSLPGSVGDHAPGSEFRDPVHLEGSVEEFRCLIPHHQRYPRLQ